MALNKACYTDSKIGNPDSIYELKGELSGGEFVGERIRIMKNATANTDSNYLMRENRGAGIVREAVSDGLTAVRPA